MESPLNRPLLSPCTHACAYANTYTHMQHTLLSVDAAMHAYSSSQRPSFLRLVSFPYSRRQPMIPRNCAICLIFSISLFLTSSVPRTLSSSLHQFTTHLRHLHCESILLYRSVAIISRIFSSITGNPPAGFFTIPAARLRLPQPISHYNI